MGGEALTGPPERPGPPPPPGHGWRRLAGSTFSSLRIRNYRLFFGGQVVSVSGSWMQRVAQSWLVLSLSGSGVALGMVAALQFLPILLFGIWGGLVADRVDKRRLLLLTQAAMGALAVALGLVTLLGVVQLWMVYVMTLLLGVVTAIDNPTRQAFVMELVGREHVTNAVSLNSAVFTGARILGPAVAGVLIALVGTGWCFVLNGASFGGVMAALVLMDQGRLMRSRAARRQPGQLREGLRHAWNRAELRTSLLLMAAAGGFAFNWTVVLPLLAWDTFKAGADAYGLLFAVLGLGSLLGALFTASRNEPSPRLQIGALALFGVLTLAAAAAPNLAVELGLLVPMGVAALVFTTTTNSLLQLRSDPGLRGRVMALYTVVFLGTAPIGAPITGWIAQAFGPRVGMALGGVVVLLAALLGLRMRRRGPGRGHGGGPGSVSLDRVGAAGR